MGETQDSGGVTTVTIIQTASRARGKGVHIVVLLTFAVFHSRGLSIGLQLERPSDESSIAALEV
jgi:hypothetical protein